MALAPGGRNWQLIYPDYHYPSLDCQEFVRDDGSLACYTVASEDVDYHQALESCTSRCPCYESFFGQCYVLGKPFRPSLILSGMLKPCIRVERLKKILGTLLIFASKILPKRSAFQVLFQVLCV